MNKPVPILGLALLIAAAVSTAWWWNSPARFPVPTDLRPATAETMWPLPPESPSMPSIQRRVATLVPGLDSQENCFSLCLSPDLKQIVFGKVVENTGVDLFMATRNDVAEPFQDVQRIESTVGPETEAYPAMSPDGLELYFIRSDGNPMIWVARRAAPDAAFGPPEEWSICKVDEQASRVGTPQAVSAIEILFSRVDTVKNTRSIWSCTRQSGNSFSAPKVYATPDGSPTAFFNPEGQRAYYCTVEDGLYFMWRESLTAPFGPPTQLLPGTATGPVDGTIWVAPKEDALFYCSPGPGQKPGMTRKLWMIGY